MTTYIFKKIESNRNNTQTKAAWCTNSPLCAGPENGSIHVKKITKLSQIPMSQVVEKILF